MGTQGKRGNKGGLCMKAGQGKMALGGRGGVQRGSGWWQGRGTQVGGTAGKRTRV